MFDTSALGDCLLLPWRHREGGMTAETQASGGISQACPGQREMSECHLREREKYGRETQSVNRGNCELRG